MSGSEDEADFASADEGEPETQSREPGEKGTCTVMFKVDNSITGFKLGIWNREKFYTGFFMPRHQKVVGYYVIPSEILSVRPSVCPSVRPSVRQRPPPFLYRQLLLQF